MLCTSCASSWLLSADRPGSQPERPTFRNPFGGALQAGFPAVHAHVPASSTAPLRRPSPFEARTLRGSRRLVSSLPSVPYRTALPASLVRVHPFCAFALHRVTLPHLVRFQARRCPVLPSGLAFQHCTVRTVSSPCIVSSFHPHDRALCACGRNGSPGLDGGLPSVHATSFRRARRSQVLDPTPIHLPR